MNKNIPYILSVLDRASHDKNFRSFWYNSRTNQELFIQELNFIINKMENKNVIEMMNIYNVEKSKVLGKYGKYNITFKILDEYIQMQEVRILKFKGDECFKKDILGMIIENKEISNVGYRFDIFMSRLNSFVKAIMYVKNIRELIALNEAIGIFVLDMTNENFRKLTIKITNEFFQKNRKILELNEKISLIKKTERKEKFDLKNEKDKVMEDKNFISLSNKYAIRMIKK